LVEVLPPADQVIVPPSHPVAVKIAFSVPQIVVLLADISGADGFDPGVTIIVFDAGLLPHIFTQYAL
jgi:hypothetical protein